MNTNDRTREHISALADGEVSDSDAEIALAALRHPDAQSEWDTYHQIGDVLRSADMAMPLSANFSARMASRLAAEPVIIAPAVVRNPQPEPQLAALAVAPAVSRFKRFAMPGMAAAAVATAAFVTTPHLMVASKGNPAAVEAPIMMVAAPAAPAAAKLVPQAQVATTADAKIVTLDQLDGVVMRDPRMDEYLMAHQRFSPSVYSTAQYARSATFATDSGK